MTETRTSILPPEMVGVMTPIEIWADVDDYNGLYQVSTAGNARSLYRPDIGKGISRKGVVLKFDFSNKDGRHRITLSKRGITKRFTVSRLILQTFGGCPPSDKHECNHKNGNPLDDNCFNLEWVTKSENNLHAYQVLGRPTMRGERNGQSKLVESEVKEIRRLWKNEREKWTFASMGKRYGVTSGAIKGIVYGKTWRYIL